MDWLCFLVGRLGIFDLRRFVKRRLYRVLSQLRVWKRVIGRIFDLLSGRSRGGRVSFARERSCLFFLFLKLSLVL